MADEREEAANVEEKEGTQPEEDIDEDEELTRNGNGSRGNLAGWPRKLRRLP
jgi:hypothetical protein